MKVGQYITLKLLIKSCLHNPNAQWRQLGLKSSGTHIQISSGQDRKSGAFIYINSGRGRKSGGVRATAATASLAPLQMQVPQNGST